MAKGEGRPSPFLLSGEREEGRERRLAGWGPMSGEEKGNFVDGITA